MTAYHGTPAGGGPFRRYRPGREPFVRDAPVGGALTGDIRMQPCDSCGEEVAISTSGWAAVRAMTVTLHAIVGFFGAGERFHCGSCIVREEIAGGAEADADGP